MSVIKRQISHGAHSLPGPVAIGGALVAYTDILAGNLGWQITPGQMGALALFYGWIGARLYSIGGMLAAKYLNGRK